MVALTLTVALTAGCNTERVTWDFGPPPTDAAVDADMVPDIPADTTPSKPCSALKIKSGEIQGIEQPASCAYKGIPYADPPVGDLRWAKPKEKTPWSDTLSAYAYGKVCPQPPTYNFPKAMQSEDCLTLNVWAPDPMPTKAAPVLVYFNKGDGYVTYGSAQPWSDGTRLAEDQGLVVVTFNYRLGALGGLAHPALGTDSGNYGVHDQLLVLDWVQQNIDKFGGDPNNVTLYGSHWTGAYSVLLHLVSKLTAGKFHRAIMGSGQPQFHGLTRAEAEAQALAFTKAIGCDTASDVVTCLRKKTADQVLNAPLPLRFWYEPTSTKSAVWLPHVEKTLWDGHPMDLLKAGKINKVPVIIGTSRDDGGSYIADCKTMGAPAYKVFLEAWFGTSNAAKILAAYPLSSYPSSGSRCTQTAYQVRDASGDGAYTCPHRQAARALTAAGVDVYLYQHTLPISYCNFLPQCKRTDPWDVGSTGAGAFKVYVFGTELKTPTQGWDKWVFNADEKALNAAVQSYWSSFAATGDPNGSGVPTTWPKYDKTSEQHLDLGKPIQVGKALKNAKCDFWDGLVQP